MPRTHFGNPILRTRSKDLAANFVRTALGKRLIAQMFYTMRKANGVGLAAPQIGKGIRLAVIEVYPVRDPLSRFRRDGGSRSERLISNGVNPQKVVILNPKIPWRSKEKA
ncbi:MAG: peptide deformylase, partial [Patescibacteria group bacterium]